MTIERIEELAAKARAGTLTPEDEAEVFAALREAIIYRDKFAGALELSNKYNKKWRMRIAELEAENAALREDLARLEKANGHLGKLASDRHERILELERDLVNEKSSHAWTETRLQGAIDAARKERSDT